MKALVLLLSILSTQVFATDDSVFNKQVEIGKQAIFDTIMDQDYLPGTVFDIDFSEAIYDRNDELKEIQFDVFLSTKEFSCNLSYAYLVEIEDVEELDGECEEN